MLLMPLRRTPVLPLERGLSPPSCAIVGASSVAGVAGGGLGPGHGGGRGSAALRIAFCQLPHFSADFYRSVAPLVEADWWLLPPPIAGSFFLLLSPLVLPAVCACVRRGAV